MSCPPTTAQNNETCGNMAARDLLDFIPFVGPAAKGYVNAQTEEAKKRQEALDTKSKQLDEKVSEWRKDITDLSTTNAQLIKELLTLIAGPENEKSNEDSYVGQVTALAVEPISERQGYVIVSVGSLAIAFFLILPKIING